MVLSFDDGYRDNLTYAFPILKKYGFTAIIFLVSGCVGSVSEWDEGGAEPLLNWEEIKEMCRGGMEFGSHGQTHRLLPALSEEEMKKEIEQSKNILEKRLGQTVEFFSYPWGKFDESVKGMVASCGYRASFSTLPGKNGRGEDPFALRRILIRGYDSRLHFLLNLKLGRSRI
jgi:peptidoglycan/xylan/chitin deacetylase (PgdA/CDA1 family)